MPHAPYLRVGVLTFPSVQKNPKTRAALVLHTALMVHRDPSLHHDDEVPDERGPLRAFPRERQSPDWRLTGFRVPSRIPPIAAHHFRVIRALTRP